MNKIHCVTSQCFKRDVPGYPRYSYSGDASQGVHNLIISGITLHDDGEYQCQVGPTNTNPPIWAAANVTVLLAPTSISIVGWDDDAVVEVVEGTALTLECLVTDARPPPSVEWFRDGMLIHSDVQEDELEPSTMPRRMSIRSRLVVTAGPEDDSKEYSCRALHPALKGSPASMVASIVLSVLHKPRPPLISGYQTGEVIREGDRRTLTCSSEGGNPRPWVLWYRQGRLLDDTTKTEGTAVVNRHELAVTPAEDGVVFECRVTSDLMQDPLVANITLTVYYAPSSVTITGASHVLVGKAISLSCETSDSNPPASLDWSVDDEIKVALSSYMLMDVSSFNIEKPQHFGIALSPFDSDWIEITFSDKLKVSQATKLIAFALLVYNSDEVTAEKLYRDLKETRDLGEIDYILQGYQEDKAIIPYVMTLGI
ncbi:synaptogenesis protein syg-2-like [Oratosquilla oratoria]|uniref:synaptogenesis protein syg-2-like n=1 Tax=Oratosquilla oratoria TaxID=337810 RepID=UPI003F77460A